MTTQSKRNIAETVLNIGIFLLIPIWVGFAPKCLEWFKKEENGIGLKRLYKILNGSLWINIPICFVFLCVVILWCCKIWKDHNFRFHRLTLPALGIVVLFYPPVEYAIILGNFSYKWFFALLFAAFIIVVVKVYLKNNKKTSKELDNQIKGFSDDNTSKVGIPEPLKNYAQEIVNRLVRTDIKEQSFALGVTGEWGVGKTTFLNELKEKIKEHAEIVEFNPWMCNSPEQVTSDFFASLRHQLSPKYSRLSNPIKEYAKYIGNLSLSGKLFSLEYLLPIKQESLFEKKKSLSQQFSKLPCPVVVIIDDVDRLERDEVFEVLRLIRNTADLSNMIYMVAYDKEYVTCVLEEKNIKDSSAYLEKIFPVEVHLPKVEDYLIWDTLRSEIEAHNSLNKDFPKGLFSKFNSDDRELILKILDNYRRAKRFARLFMLNLAYINKNANKDFKILDVFWLELLQMYDKKSYDVLANEPNLLLYRDYDRFRIRNGVVRPANEKDSNKYEGTLFWKDETPKILEKLFGDYIRTIGQSVCYTENYDKFFTLSVSPFRLSIEEMNELLEVKRDPNVIVKEWVNGKYFNSIAYQFKQISVSKINDEQRKAYVQGVLCFAKFISLYQTDSIWEAKKLLWRKHYSKDLAQEVQRIVLEWLENEMEKDNSKELLYLGRLLNKLYVTKCYDFEENEEPFDELVISNSEIENYLVKVMETYLSANSELSALDVLTERSELAYMFKSCCVNVESHEALNDYYYKQLAFDVVIKHFASKENKPTLEEFEKLYGNLFHQNMPTLDNLDDEYEYWDYMRETFDNNMQAYFGSLYERKDNNKLDEFKTKCFVRESAEKKEGNPTEIVKPTGIQGQNKKLKIKQLGKKRTQPRE